MSPQRPGMTVELPRSGLAAIFGWLAHNPAGGAVRADASGLRTADGWKTPWTEIVCLAVRRNRLGRLNLQVALRDGGLAQVGVPLGVSIETLRRFVEVVDQNFAPAR